MTNVIDNTGVGSFTFGSLIDFDASCQVFIRQRWADTWVLDDRLVCTNVTWSASPALPTASITYRYGYTAERDGDLALRPKLNLDGYYVRIVVTCSDGVRKWHGFVDDTGDEQFGIVRNYRYDLTEDDVIPFDDPTGKQTFSCVGMLAALDRTPLLNHVSQTSVALADVNFAATDLFVRLSPPNFNPRSMLSDERGHFRQIPNRSTSLVTGPSYFGAYNIGRTTHVFRWNGVESLAVATLGYWSSKTIVEYLVAYHAPKNEDRIDGIPVFIDDPNTILVSWDKPILDCAGLTLKGALDRILSTRQSMGYDTYVNEATNRLMIRPYSMLEADITISGNTIKKNALQFDCMVVTDPASSCSVQKSVSASVNQVVVRGAKRIVIATLDCVGRVAGSNNALDRQWTSTEVTDFTTAHPAINLPSGTSQESFNLAKDALESGRYKHLFRNLILNRTWNQQVGASSTDKVFELDSYDASGYYDFDPGAARVRYLPAANATRILNYLPLKEGLDYTQDVAADHLTSTKSFRHIEAYAKGFSLATTSDGGTPAGKPTIWSHRGKRDVLYNYKDPDYYVSVSPLSSDIGIGLEVNLVGASQWILSGNDMSHLPGLRWSELQFTVAIEEDRRVEQAYPETIPEVDGVLRKVFDLGEGYQQIEILPGTIVGITETDFVKRTTRYFIRDDRPELNNLAKQFYKFFTTARNVSRINSRRVSAMLEPGQMIRELNPSTGHEVICNCVITQVSCSFPIGSPSSPPKPSMSIVTSKGEFDPLFFAPKLK